MLDPLRPLPMSPSEVADLVARCRANSANIREEIGRAGAANLAPYHNQKHPFLPGESERDRKNRLFRDWWRKRQAVKAARGIRWDNP